MIKSSANIHDLSANMTKIVCKYDEHCLQIWRTLSANMTKIVCKYDENCLQMSLIAGFLDFSIPGFLQAC